ncbi:TPA: hypothetical protein ACWWCX_002778 [Enterococcus faecium]
MNKIEEVERMTIAEYELRQKAFNLKRIDTEYYIHLLAWKNNEVQARKKEGKKEVPVYKTFKSFFDYEKKVQQHISVENDKDKTFSKLLRKANS